MLFDQDFFLLKVFFVSGDNAEPICVLSAFVAAVLIAFVVIEASDRK